MNMPKDMEHFVQMMGRSDRQPLESIPIPKNYVVEVLTLAQLTVDLRDKVGYTAATMHLWGFIRKIMPYVFNKRCTLNTRYATAPMIDVTGEFRVPEVGKRGVVQAFLFPPEHIFRLYELMDLESQGPLHKYNLWSYISTHVPAVTDDSHGSWENDQNNDETWIVQKKKSDDEDE